MCVKKIPPPLIFILSAWDILWNIWKSHRPVCSVSREITLGPKNHSYAAKLISSQVNWFLTVLLPIHPAFIGGEGPKKKLLFFDELIWVYKSTLRWLWHCLRHPGKHEMEQSRGSTCTGTFPDNGLVSSWWLFCMWSPKQFTIITLRAQCQIWKLLNSRIGETQMRSAGLSSTVLNKSARCWSIWLYFTFLCVSLTDSVLSPLC